MLSLFERMSSRGMSSMSLMEYVAREEYGGELINVTLCDGFFDSASVFSKSVAELSFSLFYVLYLASGALYHIYKIRRWARDVISNLPVSSLTAIFPFFFVNERNWGREWSIPAVFTETCVFAKWNAFKLKEMIVLVFLYGISNLVLYYSPVSFVFFTFLSLDSTLGDDVTW